MVGEGVVAGLDFFVGSFDFWSFERGFPDELCVDDNANGPDVDFIGVTFALKDFGGDVVGSTADGFLFFLVVL